MNNDESIHLDDVMTRIRAIQERRDGKKVETSKHKTILNEMSAKQAISRAMRVFKPNAPVMILNDMFTGGRIVNMESPEPITRKIDPAISDPFVSSIMEEIRKRGNSETKTSTKEQAFNYAMQLVEK